MEAEKVEKVEERSKHHHLKSHAPSLKGCYHSMTKCAHALPSWLFCWQLTKQRASYRVFIKHTIGCCCTTVSWVVESQEWQPCILSALLTWKVRCWFLDSNNCKYRSAFLKLSEVIVPSFQCMSALTGLVFQALLLKFTRNDKKRKLEKTQISHAFFLAFRKV